MTMINKKKYIIWSLFVSIYIITRVLKFTDFYKESLPFSFIFRIIFVPFFSAIAINYLFNNKKTKKEQITIFSVYSLLSFIFMTKIEQNSIGGDFVKNSGIFLFSITSIVMILISLKKDVPLLERFFSEKTRKTFSLEGRIIKSIFTDWPYKYRKLQKFPYYYKNIDFIVFLFSPIIMLFPIPIAYFYKSHKNIEYLIATISSVLCIYSISIAKSFLFKPHYLDNKNLNIFLGPIKGYSINVDDIENIHLKNSYKFIGSNKFQEIKLSIFQKDNVILFIKNSDKFYSFYTENPSGIIKAIRSRLEGRESMIQALDMDAIEEGPNDRYRPQNEALSV
ncbi:hypothetical protein [Neokomagataea thailandica]|uniref:DUF304 domain-containing protein n=1 Tax=Neokomagataea tanensis NBRC 106556 TaxID=1223519 RepID=A0ABQ0QLQ9_9PROT|nr:MULTISPECIES: hypothetical protein [Neokomagataea]GBR49568.1 hypothetical protein AA106556_2091 [Neokomagataea tanensis NBRC 106556]